MPPGMIPAKMPREVLEGEGWVEGEPGALNRWINASFTFDSESEEERALQIRVPARLKARRRAEDAGDEVPEAFGWS